MPRKLSVGEVLGEAFSIYGAHAGTLLPLAFWVYLAVAILDGIAAGDLTLLPLTLVFGVIAGTLYQGMVVGLVRDVHEGREASMGEMVGAALSVLAPLLGAGLLSGLGIALGLVLLVVPGLVALTFWAVIAPAIVVERTGVFGAFGRSNQLVSGNGWPVFGSVLVAFLIGAVGALFLGGIAEGISDGPLLRIVFSAIASTFTAPIAALVAAVLYYRLLAIERGTPQPAAPTPAA